jgi:peptidoglycan biosynthesis protein MviN/MurJ (putative lipid II flippase)
MITKIRTRLSAIHVNHKRVAQGAVVIAVLTLFAKIAAVAREVAIANRYGVSGVLDAYQIGVTVTTIVPVMIGSIASAVLVPRLVGVSGRDPARLRFIDELNGTVAAVAIGLMLLTWAAAPYAAELLAGAAHPERLASAIRMSTEMAPVAAFTVAIAYLSARLQSRERYGYSMSEAVPALTIMALVLAPFGLGDPLPLVLGTVIGSFLQLVLLVHLTRRGDPPLGSIRIMHQSAEWRSLYGSILLMGFGQLLLAVSTPVDQGFAARIGEGAVATLGYANRILALFTGLGSIVVARALLPVLSRSVTEGNLTIARRQSRQWAILLGAGAALTAAIGWFLAPTVVRLMFERGAFNAEATSEVSRVLQFGLLQLPFYFGGMAIVQLIIAIRGYRALLAIAAAAICLKIILNILLVPVLGLPAIMIATAAMYALSLVGQLIYSRAAS